MDEAVGKRLPDRSVQKGAWDKSKQSGHLACRGWSSYSRQIQNEVSDQIDDDQTPGRAVEVGERKRGGADPRHGTQQVKPFNMRVSCTARINPFGLLRRFLIQIVPGGFADGAKPSRCGRIGRAGAERRRQWTQPAQPLSVCSLCVSPLPLDCPPKAVFESTARDRKEITQNVPTGSTLPSVEESRTGKPQWCILRNWEFREISNSAYLTWSGVLPKTSGVIAQNVVFVEQETP